MLQKSVGIVGVKDWCENGPFREFLYCNQKDGKLRIVGLDKCINYSSINDISNKININNNTTVSSI